MSSFQQKIMWHAKKQENMNHSQEKKKMNTETVPEEAQAKETTKN